ncbi:MAG TPA: type VI secretion system tube protein Hcp [Xanthobacteraceae bacterium]
MAVTYFLTIDGVDGGSLVPGHAGAFEINDFDFDVSALVGAIGGTGGEAGKATFSPLTVDLAPDSGLTTLLDDAASGKVIKSIELKGVTPDGQTIYDLQLSNVVITKLAGNDGAVSLSLDYSQGAISLTTTPLNQNGSLGTSVTASWNVAENKADATIAPPTAGTINTGGGGTQTYFLTVDGVDGGSAIPGHAGAFEISGYSFDVNAVVNDIAGAGGTAGKATFPPLTVTFAPGPGLTSLLEDAASGKVIKSIELEGVVALGGATARETVYDLQLSNVVITDLASSGAGGEGGAVSLSFDYSLGAISLTTTPLGQDGALGTPTTVSWDVAENKAGATITAPVAGTTDTGGGGAQKYFLTIDSVDGGSLVTGHTGAFLVKDYSFDVSAVIDAIAGRIGKATFSPLTVDFAPTSGLTSLLSDAASGKIIKSIELEGVTSDGKTVYDLELSNVVITDLANSGSSGESSGVSLSFDYNQGAISLTTTPRNQDGSLGMPVTVSWDVAKNEADATIAAPVAGTNDTGGGGTQTYFLTIDGVDGGSAAPGHAGAFAISDYSFDVNAVVNDIADAGAGGTTGKTTFAPLTVEFKPGSGLTSLLEDAASGKVIKSIDLQGVVTPAGAAQSETVYDLQLSNVVVTKLASSGASGDGGAVTLSLDYSQGAISLTTTPLNQDGSPGTPTTVSWDVAENKAGATIAAPIADTTNTGGGGAQKYFLTIDGVDGGALAVGHTGAFVIDDYSFDVSALVGAALGEAGKATFSPLTVDFTPDSGLTSLLGDAAGGKVIKSIELKGVTANGTTVYDLTLGNVVITNFASGGAGGSSGSESVSFSYTAVSLTTTPLNQNGVLGTPVTVSWDVAKNKADATISPPVAGKVDTGGGGTQTYFLTIDGIAGDSLAPGHAGAFDVSSYSFDVSALAGALGTGGTAGKSTFSPLKVTVAPDSNLTSLLADAASGTVIKSIELQGVATPNGTTTKATVYDLKLTNVVVTNFDSSGVDGNSGLDTLSFDYSRGTVSLTTTPIEENGALGTPSTVSWDVANNRLLGAPGPSVTDTTTPGEEVAHDKTIAIGTVTPGSPGDTLTLTELTGPAGAVTLSDGVVSFAAPASGDVAFSYRISDQLGDLSAVVSDTLTVDPGPRVADNTTPGEKVAHDRTIPVGTVTPGLPGDTVTLTELTGPAGAVTLSNGIVNFAAPSSGDVAFSYQISDQLGDVSTVVSDTLTVDPGPGVTDNITPGEEVAHDKTIPVGTVTPGLSGDTLTLTELTGPTGAVTLADGIISFAAPANGDIAFSYQISDQLGDVSTVFSDTLTIDPGPSVTDNTTAGEKIAHDKTIPVGTVAPGLAGDALTLTELTGPAGALTLANGIISFAAPSSGDVAFSYQITDQLGDVSAVVSDTLTVDPGPRVTDATTPGERVVHGTTVTVAGVTPGLPGDTLTLTELTGPAGAVTLNNGVVSFAAPAGASGNVAFSYQISDQLGDVSTVASDTLAVDPGPKAGSANLFVTAGERVDLTSLLLSLDTPGLAGDTLALTSVGTAGTRGTVSLSHGDLVYTAPANGTDMFTYTVSDQLHETASAGVDVSVVSKNGNIALTGTGNIVITTSGNRSVSGGTGGNFVSLGDGNDTVSLGGNGNTVLLGDGNDSVTTGDGSVVTLGHGNDLVHTGANSVVTADDGNDTITAGAGSTIRLGNGNDLVYAGANSSILFGNGNGTVFAGSNDTITLGKGNDLVAFGVNPSPPALGNEIVNGFGKNDTLEFNRQVVPDFKTLMSDARQLAGDTVITIDANDSVTLRGVAVTSLKSNNFKFT